MLHHHAGDVQNSFREFEVKFGRHDRKPMKLPVYEFVTGKGIKLSMKRKAVKFGSRVVSANAVRRKLLVAHQRVFLK